VAAIPSVNPTAEPTGFARLMHKLGMTEAGRWVGINVGARIDPWLLRHSNGRIATAAFFPLVLMTASGRKSGVERSVPLVYFTDGEEVILTASSFGREKHPAWYYNAVAAEEVELFARGHRGRYLVLETEGAERDRLFELSKQLYAGYGIYEEKTAAGRTIPVLALRPAPAHPQDRPPGRRAR
jgi:deazaflavin-dependent oxidoreductase (nitroreductase family)